MALSFPARFNGKCCLCGARIHKGELIVHARARRNRHVTCPQDWESPKPHTPTLPPLSTPPPIKPMNISRSWLSWDSYLNYVDSLGPPIEGDTSGRDDSSFTDHTSLSKAKDLARNGWTKGIGIIQSISAPMVDKVGSQIERLDPFYTEEPGSIDFGRYFDGEPECCLQLAPVTVKGPGKFVRILINGGVSHQIDTITINNRGAVVMALIELLEYAGCRVELTLYFSGCCHGNTKSTLDEYILLKPFEQPLDSNRLAFIGLHPASFRRIQFRAMEGHPSEVRTHFGIRDSGYYTTIANSTDETLSKYDIHFERLIPDTVQFDSKEHCTDYIVEELKKQGVFLT